LYFEEKKRIKKKETKKKKSKTMKNIPQEILSSFFQDEEYYR